MGAVHLIHRITIEPKTETFGVALRVVLEKFVAELGLRIERVEIKIALQRREVRQLLGQIADSPRLRNVIPLVVIGLEAETRRDLGMMRDVIIEIFIEKFVGAFGFGRDLLRRVDLSRGKARGRERRADDQAYNSFFHNIFLPRTTSTKDTKNNG